jgi:hypothetical protein
MKRTWNTIGLTALVASMIFLGGCGESAPDEVPAEERQGYGKTYTFALNYPAGEYVQETSMDMDQKMQVSGQKINQTITMFMGVSMDVAEHNAEGGFVMDMKFTRYKMEMVQQGNTLIDYDSAVPAKSSTEPLKTIFGELLKLDIKIDYDKDGNVQKATGTEEYLDVLAKDPALRGQLDSMKKMLSNETLARQTQSAKAVLPSNPVTLEDTWPVVINDGLRIIEGTARLYEVVSTPEGDLATIKMTGEMKEMTDMLNVEFEDCDVDYEAVMQVYVATGVAKTNDMKIGGALKMRTQGQTIEMDMTAKTKATMEKVK